MRDIDSMKGPRDKYRIEPIVTITYPLTGNRRDMETEREGLDGSTMSRHIWTKCP